MSKQFDFKKLEKDLWSAKPEDRLPPPFSAPGLSPANVGLASIRMKRWSRRLVSASVVLIVLSILLWAAKSHHIIKVSTQDGLVKVVEMIVNE